MSKIKKTIVINVRHTDYDVYIGRPSKFGNPFIIGRDGDRNEVIEKHWRWLNGEIQAPNGEVPPTVEEIKEELTGKRLGCHCAPLRCHGDIYQRICDE